MDVFLVEKFQWWHPKFSTFEKFNYYKELSEFRNAYYDMNI